MNEQTLQALKALSALTAVAELSSEVAAIAQRLQALADSLTTTIDPLAPALGVTVEVVFAPLWD
jgi:hypothetical protein